MHFKSPYYTIHGNHETYHFLSVLVNPGSQAIVPGTQAIVPGTGAPAIVPVLPGNAVISSLPQQAMIQLAQANATAAIVTSRVWGTDQPATASTPTKVNSF